MKIHGSSSQFNIVIEYDTFQYSSKQTWKFHIFFHSNNRIKTP